MASSCGVNAVEFCFEQFIRSAVAENLPRERIDDVGKNHDLIRRVIVYAFAFRYESAQHPVMAFYRSLFAGCIRMREIHVDAFVFQMRKIRKLRAIVRCDRLEYLKVLVAKALKKRIECFVNCLCRMILYLQPDGMTQFSLCQSNNSGLVFPLFTEYAVQLPMPEFFP